MGQLFSKGQKLSSPSGTEYKIEEFIGGGGQGEVYRVSSNGKNWALKWYLPHQVTDEQRKIIENLILKGSPADKFLWPIELITTSKFQGFGYTMPLRPKNYFELQSDLFTRKIHPTFYALSTAGFQLADSFFHLHINGLAYQDISPGNIFLDPKNGDILICDNDNVVVNKTKTSIIGTPRFKAPEIVRKEASPSTDTDRFSLSVLLFYMLFLHHPLEGKRAEDMPSDEKSMNELFGNNPIFIFDPNNHSNSPDPQYQTNPIEIWPIYPQFIRDLFTRSFTKGLKDPQNGRVLESEWKSAFMKLRDSIIYCQKCGAENFYDLDIIKNASSNLPKCWHCKADITLPPRIKIGNLIIMLTHHTQLFHYHLDPISYDLSKPIAEINVHPTNPGIWGLKNLSDRNWLASFPDGKKIEVSQGKNISLSNGSKINFGSIEGEIKI